MYKFLILITLSLMIPHSCQTQETNILKRPWMTTLRGTIKIACGTYAIKRVGLVKNFLHAIMELRDTPLCGSDKLLYDTHVALASTGLILLFDGYYDVLLVARHIDEVYGLTPKQKQHNALP